MEPDDYAMQKVSQKLSKSDRRQGKQWTHAPCDSEPSVPASKSRSKKGQHRADFSSYLGFQLKKPQTQTSVSMPQRPKLLSGNRNITLSPYFSFAMKFPADYCQFHIDPNLPLEWENVLWVRKLTDSESACPICLEGELTAPRVSRCGHCFCFPCVLQYLSHGERQDKRCPVCFDTIKSSALKPVEVVKTKSLSEGYTATFTLMRRRKGKIGVFACGQPLTGHVYQDLPDARCSDSRFNRLCISYDPRSLWSRHLDQLRGAREKIDAAFCEKAMEITEMERERLPEAGFVRVPPYDAPCNCCKVIHPLNLTVIDAKVCPTHGQNSEEVYIDCRETPEAPEPDKDEDAFFYFYQFSDGQPYFLHPLTTRTLVKQFGSWSLLPTTVTAKVLEVEDATMTEYTSRKLKVLSHLCKGAGFYLVELDLSTVCSAETLGNFREETEARRVARCQHKQREDRQQQTISRRREEQEKQTQEFYRLPAAVVPPPFVNEPLLPVAQEPASIWSNFKEVLSKPQPQSTQKKPQQAKKGGSRRKTSDPDYEELIADESYSQYIVETSKRSLSDLFK